MVCVRVMVGVASTDAVMGEEAEEMLEVGAEVEADVDDELNRFS